MSDETTPAASPEVPLAATAAVAASVRALEEDVAKLKKQVKSVWAAVIVAIVLVVAVAGFTMLPRLFGFRMMGGPGGFRGQGFQPGQNGAQQFPGGGQGGQQQGAPTAPGQ